MTSEDLYSQALASYSQGNLEDTISKCSLVIAASKTPQHALMLRAMAWDAQGSIDEAIADYQELCRTVPGNGYPQTRLSCLHLRRALGSPPAPRALTGGEALLAMSNLGKNGRFGNQILQYGMLRQYAAANDAVAVTPNWIGRDLFDLDDPLAPDDLPIVDEGVIDAAEMLAGRGQVNIDISGFFQGAFHLIADRKEQFRSYFAPGRRIAPLIDKVTEFVRNRGRTLVALHLRGGDFGYGPFWVAPYRWYHEWLERIWPILDQPVLYIATDCPDEARRSFDRYNPLLVTDCPLPMDDLAFVIDHFMMREADCLAIANSSFSGSAALLNTRCRLVARPHPDRRRLVEFDPWEDPFLLHPTDPDPYLTKETRFLTKFLVKPSSVLVSIGRHCEPWTTYARNLYNKTIRVWEIEPDSGLDQLRRANRLESVDVLALGPGVGLSALLDGGVQSLTSARVNFVLLEILDIEPELLGQIDAMRRHGYRLLLIADEAVIPFEGAPPRPGSYAFIHQRLLELYIPGSPHQNLASLCHDHGIRIRGILHIGAHEGKEVPDYKDWGADPIVMIEANPAVYSTLMRNIADQPGVTAINCAISDRAGPVELHVTSMDQSSSLLPLAKHAEFYPDIKPVETITVEGFTLDGLLADRGLRAEDFSLLTIDIQGAEGLALRGARKTLAHVDAVNVEISFSELYAGCSQIEDIDEILREAGFKRVHLSSPYHVSWGDAFYVRAG